jgi:hypothetical protein
VTVVEGHRQGEGRIAGSYAMSSAVQHCLKGVFSKEDTDCVILWQGLHGVLHSPQNNDEQKSSLSRGAPLSSYRRDTCKHFILQMFEYMKLLCS